MAVAGSPLEVSRVVLIAKDVQSEVFKKIEGKWRHEQRNKLMGCGEKKKGVELSREEKIGGKIECLS